MQGALWVLERAARGALLLALGALAVQCEERGPGAGLQNVGQGLRTRAWPAGHLELHAAHPQHAEPKEVEVGRPTVTAKDALPPPCRRRQSRREFHAKLEQIFGP